MGRKVVRLLAVLFLASVVCGCTSAPYWRNRRLDAADVVTLTVGIGDGVKARIGPLQVAALRNSDLAGLRSGCWFLNGNDLVDNDELYSPVPFTLLGVRTTRIRTSFAQRSPSRLSRYQPPAIRLQQDAFVGSNWPTYSGYEQFSFGLHTPASCRGKDIVASSPVPLLAVSRKPSYYADVEVVVGLLFSLRIGINPLEIVDFLAGWAGVDILGDDLTHVDNAAHADH
jgi:hypothetical protein